MTHSGDRSPGSCDPADESRGATYRDRVRVERFPLRSDEGGACHDRRRDRPARGDAA